MWCLCLACGSRAVVTGLIICIPCLSDSSGKTLLDPGKENCKTQNITLITKYVTLWILENGLRSSASPFPSPSLTIMLLISQTKEVKLVFGFFNDHFYFPSLWDWFLVEFMLRILLLLPKWLTCQSSNSILKCLETIGQLFDIIFVLQNSLI